MFSLEFSFCMAVLCQCLSANQYCIVSMSTYLRTYVRMHVRMYVCNLEENAFCIFLYDILYDHRRRHHHHHHRLYQEAYTLH